MKSKQEQSPASRIAQLEKELEIEAALEKVRARTMAMQKSDELAETVSVLFKQLIGLGIPTEQIRTCGIVTFDAKEPIGEQWITEMNGDIIPRSFMVPYNEAPAYKTIYQWWKNGREFEVNHLKGAALQEHLGYLAKYTKVPLSVLTEGSHDIYNHALFFSQGYLFVITRSAMPGYHDIFKRFGVIFRQSYTRFLDLLKAEAQAREARIETSLERVRSKTMAMHNSEDVGDTVATMFDEVVKLGVEKTIRCGILIIDNSKHMEVWTASSNPNEEVALNIGRIDMMVHPMLQNIHEAWKKKRPDFSYEMIGDDLKNYYQAINDAPDYPAHFEIASLPSKQTVNVFFFPEGGIFVFSPGSLVSETSQVFKRFAGVFGQTYTRFLDLQRAEAQAREAQIEASLEKVRSKAMAMHNSDDLSSAASLVFTELKKLGITAIRCGVGLFSKEAPRSQLYSATNSKDSDALALIGWIDMAGHPVLEKIYSSWVNQEDYFPVLNGKELKAFYKKISPGMNMSSIPGAGSDEKQYGHFLYFTEGALNTWAERPYSEPELKILDRFKSIISLTFRRYLDLKKAETQAREAQIEAALERVRSKTMAMHNSDDVGGTVAMMFNELIKLGVEKAARCGIAILDEARMMELWTARLSENEKADLAIGHIDMHIHPMLTAIYDAWKNKESSFSYELAGDDLSAYITAINSYPDYPIRYDISLLGSKQFHSDFFFPEGMLFVFTSRPFDEAISSIFKRFAGVFGQTYRRYLDLQKAETAAREAQIEAALERVRGKAMAMYNSADLTSTASMVFTELRKLGISPLRCGVGITSKSSPKVALYSATTSADGDSLGLLGWVVLSGHPVLVKINESILSGEDYFPVLKGKQLKSYYENLLSGLSLPSLPDFHPGEEQYGHFFSIQDGCLYAWSEKRYNEAEIRVLKRFASVIDLTYTRYNDLKQAEEQTREATIEAALERVRGKAMAMRTSADLSLTTGMVFSELRKLGIDPLRCGVVLPSKNSPVTELYVATPTIDSHSLDLAGTIKLSGHLDLQNQYHAWLKKENYFTVLKGEELKSYKEVIYNMLPVPYSKSYHEEFGYYLYFTEGFLFAWADKSFSESEFNILNRFKAIVDLTFRRYIELQKSEAIARDAVREASLDRVRAEIASMRSTEDLGRITPLIWNELTILGIPFIRCGVFIIDEQDKLIHTHLSTADGKALATFDLKFDSGDVVRIAVPAWREKQMVTHHWSAEEFAAFTKSLVDLGTVKSQEKYVTEHPDTSLDLHFFPFLQGMLYVGNVALLGQDQKDLVQSLADAFSTAYARYEDFNKLEAAKEQVENTLTELKAAQTKLIQSEKMASLGELTAGIAHEIQNPLNFVNNFSEVNQEMIDELAEELKSGNIDQALALAADIKRNEEKINHHGKRADGIVKGMLQHSRSSSGDKQPTDINTLADEFMRLAYHGLRSKDKSFNSETITNFDDQLPKINVVPQDMGRVMLNLFNNAFYAVNQRQKIADDDYKPEVSVATLSENGQVIIKVKDNGMGIPDAIKDKIMQPFFTTKPTGEGTGLGLSLTYDMVVKGHGGSIQVKSVEGEGSEFIVQLPIAT